MPSFKLRTGIWSAASDLKVLPIHDFSPHAGLRVECTFSSNMMSVIWVYAGHDTNGVCAARPNRMNNLACIVRLCRKSVFISRYFILHAYEQACKLECGADSLGKRSSSLDCSPVRTKSADTRRMRDICYKVWKACFEHDVKNEKVAYIRAEESADWLRNRCGSLDFVPSENCRGWYGARMIWMPNLRRSC